MGREVDGLIELASSIEEASVTWLMLSQFTGWLNLYANTNIAALLLRESVRKVMG